MIEKYRSTFNRSFSDEKYDSLNRILFHNFNLEPGFRIAETPLFLPKYLQIKLKEACTDILSVVTSDSYRKESLKSIPKEWNCKGDSQHPNFIVADFAITQSDEGELHPMLIEAQGFPSVFFFQQYLDKAFREVYDLPNEVNPYFQGIDAKGFSELLKHIILANHKP